MNTWGLQTSGLRSPPRLPLTGLLNQLKDLSLAEIRRTSFSGLGQIIQERLRDTLLLRLRISKRHGSLWDPLGRELSAHGAQGM